MGLGLFHMYLYSWGWCILGQDTQPWIGQATPDSSLLSVCKWVNEWQKPYKALYKQACGTWDWKALFKTSLRVTQHLQHSPVDLFSFESITAAHLHFIQDSKIGEDDAHKDWVTSCCLECKVFFTVTKALCFIEKSFSTDGPCRSPWTHIEFLK